MKPKTGSTEAWERFGACPCGATRYRRWGTKGDLAKDLRARCDCPQEPMTKKSIERKRR